MRSRYSVAIIITVVVLLELISFVQLMFARKGIRDEVESGDTKCNGGRRDRHG